MTNRKSHLIGLMNAYSQGKSGGDEIFIQTLKKLKNYHKTVVTSGLGKKLCQESGLKAKFLITSREKKFERVIFTYLKRIIKALSLNIEVKDKDLILASSDILPDVLPAFFLKRKNRKTKWVQKIYHFIPSLRILSRLAQRLSLFLIKKYADAVVVDNQILKKDLLKLGFNKKRVSLNYPGIDFAYLNSIKPDKNKKSDGVFIGQIRKTKGLLVLIDIWKLVSRKNLQAKLLIIGKGDIKTTKNLKIKVKSLGLEKNIEFLGYLPDKQAFSIMKASKIFVFPSLEEGFGIAPLQAQVLGLPVVAWNLPLFEEIFPKGMVKISLMDKKKFSHCIIKLLTDNQYYKRLSKEATINAQKYEQEKFFKRELEIIKSVNEDFCHSE